ncbi:MAG: hypothetical protein COV46_05515 [Deltaproteobacteria bacterium CG11_big_fil_rev_8_21_14_0_20_49_13]|nr:MAG: hypothetical protein COV46_05515 [Deltaproteobacteria bacterium CG11_big_fil_rev_8_21_14_0_20_49_13]
MANPISAKKATLTIPRSPGYEKVVKEMCKSANAGFQAQCGAYKKGALDSYNGFMQNTEKGMKFIFDTLKGGKLNGTTVEDFASIQKAVKACKKLPTSLTEDLFTPEKAPAIFANLQACVDGIAKARFVAAAVVPPPAPAVVPAPAAEEKKDDTKKAEDAATVPPAAEKANALEALPAIGLGELMESFLMDFGKSMGTDYSNAVAMFQQGEEKKSWKYGAVSADMKAIAARALGKYTQMYGDLKELNALRIPLTVKVDNVAVKITDIAKGDAPEASKAYDAMMAEAGKVYDAYLAHAKEVLDKDPVNVPGNKLDFAKAENGTQVVAMLKTFEASVKKQYEELSAAKKKSPVPFPKELAASINALPATEAEWMDNIAKPAVQKWLDRNDQFILQQKDFVTNSVLSAKNVDDFKKNLSILVNGINGAILARNINVSNELTNARMSADEVVAGIVYQAPPEWNPNFDSKKNAVNLGLWLRLQAVREETTVDALLAAMRYKSGSRQDADGSPAWMNYKEFIIAAGGIKSYTDYKNIAGPAKAYIAGSQAPGVTNSYDARPQGGSLGVGVAASKVVGKIGDLALVINGGVESRTKLSSNGLPGYGDLVGTEKEGSGNQLGITANVGAAYGTNVFGKKRNNLYQFALGAFGGNIGINFKVMHFVDPNVCIVAGGEYYYGNFKPLADGDRLLPSHAHSISLGACFFPGTDSVKIDIGAKLAGNKDNPLSAAVTASAGIMVDVSDDGWALGVTDKIGIPLRTNIGRDWSPILSNTLELAAGNEDPDPTVKNVRMGVRWKQNLFKGITGGGYEEKLVSKDDRLTVFGAFDISFTTSFALHLSGEIGGAIRNIPGITDDNRFIYDVGIGPKVSW